MFSYNPSDYGGDWAKLYSKEWIEMLTRVNRPYEEFNTDPEICTDLQEQTKPGDATVLEDSCSNATK